MTALIIGQATKGFLFDHLEYLRDEAYECGYELDEATTVASLYETAYILRDCTKEQLATVVSIQLPVTSAIAAALLLDNE